LIDTSLKGSLTLDAAKAWPLLIASDGFSDIGTPNAPMFAGLGDQRYTRNEKRGGQILAAERPFGQGTIVAFGDTAVLQDSSVAYGYGYISSLFDYLTKSKRWNRTVWFYWVSLFGAIFVFIAMLNKYSVKYAIVCILIICISSVVDGALRQGKRVTSQVQSDIIVIDNVHAQSFLKHDKENSISTVIELLSREKDCLVLVGDAFEIIGCTKVHGLVMISPKAALSHTERNQLVGFVSNGGRLLYASGYYESILHKQWLETFGCKISSKTLGANQQIPECLSSYPLPPKKVESWAMELKGDWNVIAKSYDLPFIAKKKIGAGTVCVFSDSYAMLNKGLRNGDYVSPEAFNFYKKLFEDVFFDPSTVGDIRK